jgi:hypothetical protein
MPTTHDRDKQEEIYRRNEAKRGAILKVVEPIMWLIVVIIVVAACLALMNYAGYFSVSNPIDALPTFSQ